MSKTQEALKLALEALEHEAEISNDDAYRKEREAIREALAQPEQDWRNAALRVGEDLCSVGPFGYYDMTAKQWLDWALSVVTVHAPPPPQRTWVDLTVEEIIAVIHPLVMADMEEVATDYEIARAIEAKLKEKNK